jgi:hypothetical protein
MPDVTKDLLSLLHEKYVPAESVYLNHFLESWLDKKSLHDAKVALATLRGLEGNYLHHEVTKKSSDTCNIGDDFGSGRPPGTIENYEWWARLLPTGYENLSNQYRQEKQDRLLYEEAQSVIATNKATAASFENQKKFGDRSLLLAGVSTLFILGTIFLQLADKTPQRLKGIEEELQKTRQILDNLTLHMKGIHYYLFAPKDSNGVKPDPSGRVP